jgi:hypothetical protein
MTIRILSLLVLLLGLPVRSESPTLYFMGRIHLAGLVPDQPPPVGIELTLTSPEQPLTHSKEQPAGFIPAVYRDQINRMLTPDIRLYFRVEHLYLHPLPGKFMSVEVWAETTDPGQLVPLIYPTHLDREPELALRYD